MDRISFPRCGRWGLETGEAPLAVSKRSWIFVACAALLALSACTSYKASLNEALAELQASLALAREALRSSTTAEQRAEARETVAAARQDLAEQPESAAKTAASTMARPPACWTPSRSPSTRSTRHRRTARGGCAARRAHTGSRSETAPVSLWRPLRACGADR